jgi:hypothetical protein
VAPLIATQNVTVTLQFKLSAVQSEKKLEKEKILAAVSC